MQFFDGYIFSLLSGINTDAETGYEPFGSLAGKDSALFLGFALAGPFPQVELNLTVYAFEDGSRSGTSRPTSCGIQETQAFPLCTNYLGNLERKRLATDRIAERRNAGAHYFRSRPAQTPGEGE